MQGLETNENFQRYPGGNEATILDLKSQIYVFKNKKRPKINF